MSCPIANPRGHGTCSHAVTFSSVMGTISHRIPLGVTACLSALVAAACASLAPTPSSDLAGTRWAVREINGQGSASFDLGSGSGLSTWAVQSRDGRAVGASITNASLAPSQASPSRVSLTRLRPALGVLP